MAKPAAGERRTGGRRRVARVGRPPLEHAGEVDARIRDAAQRVLRDRGLGGASV